MKNICVLGSTGSIGTQTLDVVRDCGNVKVHALTTNKSIDLLEEQVKEFLPSYVVVTDYDSYRKFLEKKISGLKVLYGMEGLLEIVNIKEIDLVINSLVGNIGLKPTVEAIKNKKNIGLANKETLVSAGEIIMKLAKDNNVSILPIDSEHSAIFQCLQGNSMNKIDKIFLTASGGPFRKKTYEELLNVTKEQALNHPNWVMGSKITIDSATLMNKGLEVIEAKWLFNLSPEDIQVVVHPESIIHSMVQFEDSSIIAQLGEADMKVPIQYAIFYPNRLKNNYPKMNFFDRNILTFEEPNMTNFPCLKLAYESISIGGLMPTVLNAANEVAVELFLKEKIQFMDIYKLVEKTMNNALKDKVDYSLDNIYNLDEWARQFAYKQYL